MKLTIQMGALLALVSSQLVHGWNATIYDSGNCAGNRYHIYPLTQYTKYFEMDGSWGAEIDCTFEDIKNGTAGPCKDQFPVGKSVFTSVGSCKTYSGGHSSGEREASQKEGECKTTGFSIRSVVCYDG
ncbi:hypothetical protein F5B22DRAFT_415987 [Xylaria bambusicola]|uniref:uncharacterized protein n=1 Tax=Xylaria bambusicola TaxID=326684 RepID=UPI00200826D9|nr:uncharacterized protein F5B22DRAFT_415987 [Xylaria bambusicola]KAI0523767.1 hypothetical protein F5B22DRAFT_415987 [Xylaria bambusicola]